MAQTAVWVFATWLAMGAFGLDIPLVAVCIYLPVIMFVGALPINVGGFGAVQAAWLLFAEYESAERILAFHFVWTLMVAAAVVLRGLPFVGQVLRDVAAPEPVTGATERSES